MQSSSFIKKENIIFLPNKFLTMVCKIRWENKPSECHPNNVGTKECSSIGSTKYEVVFLTFGPYFPWPIWVCLVHVSCNIDWQTTKDLSQKSVNKTSYVGSMVHYWSCLFGGHWLEGGTILQSMD